MLAVLFVFTLVFGGTLPIDADGNDGDLIAGRAAAPQGALPKQAVPAMYPVNFNPNGVNPLGSSTGNEKYTLTNPDLFTPNEVMKSGDKEDCHNVQKLYWEDECFPYVAKTCFTQLEEVCEDVYEKNCTAVIDSFEDRKCFTVTELRCELAENIQYEMVPSVYTIQRCTKVRDRVCDTVYDLAISSKDDFQCIEVYNEYCYKEDKIVKDRTCSFSVDFDCGKKNPNDIAVTCSQVPTKKCYDVPRTVREENCTPRNDTWCEKLTNEFPMPLEKQNCHTERIYKCEIEDRTKLSKAKKYVYTKECKPVSRQVCDTVERKKIRPMCDNIHSSNCDYVPKEKCTEENRQYCVKVEKYKTEKVCVPEKMEMTDATFTYV